MCDYSLQHVSWRSAKVNDKLVATEFASSSTRGFAAVGECGAKLVIDEARPKVAVCLLPGTELAFDDCVRYKRAFVGQGRINHKLARFRQIDTSDPDCDHDALEFPDGRVLNVARLVAGQTARVLELPVAAQHPEPVVFRSKTNPVESRLALNRVAAGPGVASVLAFSQGTITLWHTWRNTAVKLSTSMERSFRRLTKQHPQPALLGGAAGMSLESSFEKGIAETAAEKASASGGLEKRSEGGRSLESVSEFR